MLRRRSTAYALHLLFPLGAHRAYLGDGRGAWIYRGGSALALALWLLGVPQVAAGVVLGMALAAGRDAFLVEDRVAATNKRLRMQAYLGGGAAPPAGYRGRFPADPVEEYLAEKAREVPGHGTPASTRPRGRAPSFAEQERLLRELARAKAKRDAQ